MDSAEDWARSLEGYVDQILSEGISRRSRVRWAQLDGGWYRLAAEHLEAMAAAIERANERLPPELHIGFVDRRTGRTFGRPRTAAPSSPANHPAPPQVDITAEGTSRKTPVVSGK